MRISNASPATELFRTGGSASWIVRAARLAGAVSLIALSASTHVGAQSRAGSADEQTGDGSYVIDTPAPRKATRPASPRPAMSRPAAPDTDEASPRAPTAGVPSPSPVSPVRPIAAAPSAQGCANPNAIGVSREVEIDATGGPRFGFQQYKLHDFLREGEIVLTFDDGPAPAYTRPILQALDNHCTKATFFIVGRNALAHPEFVREEYAKGHTIGNHTWSHANLGPRKIVPKRNPVVGDAPGQSGQAGQGGQPTSGESAGLMTGSVARRSADPFAAQGGADAAPPKPTFVTMSPDKAKAEIELGFSATSRALGVPMAPFFRFPYLGNSTAMHNYLAERNVAIFSIDVDSVDYRAKKADDVINRVMTDLKDQRKGILLFHDIQPSTAAALPTLLDMLQAKGYKVVHMRPKAGLQTIASYDARVGKDGAKQDAIAEKKPLAKRTMTWGMAAPAEGGSTVATARANDAYKPPARKPVARADGRSDSPGYVPPSAGQPEILPWLTTSRRNPSSGW